MDRVVFDESCFGELVTRTVIAIGTLAGGKISTTVDTVLGPGGG